MYVSTRSWWATTELQIVQIRDTNRHTGATMCAMCILLHMVHSGPVAKYSLCL